jgi:hypothetical protein
MRTLIGSVLLVVLIAACGSRREAAACDERASELKSYLIQVFDPRANPPPPWPAGDADTDRTIDAARDVLRTAIHATSADKAPPLRGPQHGPVDDTLAGCPQARDAWAHMSSFPEPDHLTKAAIAISDGVAACGCHVNIPLIRAALYLLVRGPD